MINNNKRNKKLSNLLLFIIALAGLTLGLTTVFAFTDSSNPAPVAFADLRFDGENASKCGDDEGDKTEAEHKMSKEDGKCGEGKCGDGKDSGMEGDKTEAVHEMSKEDGKCGAGKCGDGKGEEIEAVHEMSKEDGKCGDGKDSEKKDDGKCGNGKCGDDKNTEMKSHGDNSKEDK
jgi:uncharacterized low-complexity protein